MKRLLCSALVIVILLGSGCVNEDETGDQGIAVIAEPRATIMAAQVDGILSVDERGCLLVGELFTIWPVDTVRTDDGVRYEDITLTIGDQVTGGGGYLSRADAVALVSTDSVQDLENCTADGETVVVLEVIN